jgi:hypothetical protein
VLRSEEAPTVQLGDPLGKDLIDADYLLGLPHFNAMLSSFAQGKLACHSSVENVGEGRLIGKGKLQSLLWTWKGQLVSLETEVDRALLSILEGLEKFGLADKLNCAGHKSIPSSFPTIFPKYSEQNHFLLLYQSTPHNRFPLHFSISLKQYFFFTLFHKLIYIYFFILSLPSSSSLTLSLSSPPSLVFVPQASFFL